MFLLLCLTTSLEEDYPHFIEEEAESQRRERMKEVESGGATPEGPDLLCLSLKMKRAPAKEYRRPLGTGKGEEVNSSPAC